MTAQLSLAVPSNIEITGSLSPDISVQLLLAAKNVFADRCAGRRSGSLRVESEGGFLARNNS